MHIAVEVKPLGTTRGDFFIAHDQAIGRDDDARVLREIKAWHFPVTLHFLGADIRRIPIGDIAGRD
jgi:hypothetical protein